MGPQDRSGRVWKISPPQGFDTRTVQPVASRYTDWAIVALSVEQYDIKFNDFSSLQCRYLKQL